jgi:hypothetical protein
LLAARAGLETLLIEKEKLGGTSYHKGCYVIRALQKCAQWFRASGFSEKNPVHMGIRNNGSRQLLSCLAIGPDSSEIVNQACFWLSTNTPMESFLNIST